jgi:hypothetical protein
MGREHERLFGGRGRQHIVPANQSQQKFSSDGLVFLGPSCPTRVGGIAALSFRAKRTQKGPKDFCLLFGMVLRERLLDEVT